MRISRTRQGTDVAQRICWERHQKHQGHQTTSLASRMRTNPWTCAKYAKLILAWEHYNGGAGVAGQENLGVEQRNQSHGGHSSESRISSPWQDVQFHFLHEFGIEAPNARLAAAPRPRPLLVHHHCAWYSPFDPLNCLAGYSQKGTGETGQDVLVLYRCSVRGSPGPAFHSGPKVPRQRSASLATDDHLRQRGSPARDFGACPRRTQYHRRLAERRICQQAAAPSVLGRVA
jgi:hypothetical protein